MRVRFAVSLALVVSVLSGASSDAKAWGRRGHSIICQTAAAVLAVNTPDHKGDFLKKHSFDLGLYCNTPDLVWKKPATYKIEHPQHFMDLEIFTRAFKAAGVKGSDEFKLSRLEFERKYPAIEPEAGRSYWRITELTESLSTTAQNLKVVTQASDARATLQESWLVTAGAIGHYIGDLSQPLHASENYDGVLTNQKGVHAFFEDTVVDELSSSKRPASLEAAVGLAAMNAWKSYHKKAASLSILEISESLGDSSAKILPTLLALDKKIGRSNLKVAAAAHETLIRERLVLSGLALAEIWSRHLDWTYDGNKFFNFNGAPDFVYPPGSR